MVGGTSFPPHDSQSEPWSNEQKTKATAKPSTKGKAKPEARTPAGRGIATGALEVSLDNADTVIDGWPVLSRSEGRGCSASAVSFLRVVCSRSRTLEILR